MSYIDFIPEYAAFHGANTLLTNVKPKKGRYTGSENYLQNHMKKWFGGQDRKNGGTGRVPPDRRDHACHRMWSVLEVGWNRPRSRYQHGHKISGCRWFGSLSSRRKKR